MTKKTLLAIACLGCLCGYDVEAALEKSDFTLQTKDRSKNATVAVFLEQYEKVYNRFCSDVNELFNSDAKTKNWDEGLYKFIDLVDDFNLGLAKLKTEGLPNEIVQAFENFKRASGELTACANELSILIKAKHNVEEADSATATIVLANSLAACFSGAFGVDGRQFANTAVLEGVQGAIESYNTAEKIKNGFNQLGGKLDRVLERINKKRADLYEVAAEYGDAMADNSKGGVVDQRDEVMKYRKAAEQGDAVAQHNLGCCYEFGEGVAKDAQEAVKWYRKAAEQGYANAQNAIGNCYFLGEGVAKDTQEAVKWYRKAAEQGFAMAQLVLGWCYENGEGVAKDAQESVKWYRKSAEQGNVMAQYALGFCYVDGNGVAKDMQEAVKWFRKSAEQGFAMAQLVLGYCYENGEGVAKDAQEAVKWYRKAAEQGNEFAKEALEKLGVK